MRIEVLEQLRVVVAFDAYAWLLTDPATEVGTAPVADVPWLAELPRQIRLKYQTDVNRWTALHEHAVGLLAEATGGDLARSLVWRELLADFHVCDVASVVFRDRFGCWGFLELWRRDGTFSAADAALLSALAAQLTPSLRRLQADTFDGAPQRSHPGPGVLLLSPELVVRSQTLETQDYQDVGPQPADLVGESARHLSSALDPAALSPTGSGEAHGRAGASSGQ